MGQNVLWGDMATLEVLDLWYQGYSASEIAKQFGVSRSAILGLVHRVRADTDRFPSEATKPENKDGGMPARWWARS